MFIRYNQSAKFWEYDTSGGNGTGPWATLPEIFSQNISIVKNAPTIIMEDLAGVIDARSFQIFGNGGSLYIQAVNDAVTQGAGFIFLDRNANIKNASSIQIIPSTNSNPNTLDYYEEGTWLPRFLADNGPSGATYSVQKGTYTRIGDQVIAEFQVQVSNPGVGSGNTYIAGFPYICGNTVPASGYIGIFINIVGGLIWLFTFLINGTGIAMLPYTNAAAASYSGYLTYASIQGGTEFRGSYIYSIR